MENVRFNQDFEGGDVDGKGQVFLSRQMTVDVFVDFDYWAYPFDSHLLPIEVSSFAYGSNAVTLRPLDIAGRIPKQQNIQWEILGSRTVVTTGASMYSEEDSTYTVFTAIARLPMAEICTILFPLMVIVWFTFSALFISHEDNFGDQLAVSSFGFLTVMAYSTVIYETIPKTSYSLWIHNFILYAVVFTLLIMVAVGAIHCSIYGCCVNPYTAEEEKKKKLVKQSEEEGAYKMSEEDEKVMKNRRAEIQSNKIMNQVIFWRVALPLIYIVALVYSFYRVSSYENAELHDVTAFIEK